MKNRAVKNKSIKVNTEFITDKSIRDCICLYVNGERTNIFFFIKMMLFQCSEQQQQKALLTQRWIEQGKIFPYDGNWKNFSICAPCLFHIRELSKLNEIPHWANELVGVQTNRYIDSNEHKSIIQQWTNTQQWTQFSKRIKKENISNQVGIYFWHYGYAIYFI